MRSLKTLIKSAFLRVPSWQIICLYIRMVADSLLGCAKIRNSQACSYRRKKKIKRRETIYSILVADDDKFFRDRLRDTFEKAGYRIQTVESGTAAVRKVLKETIHLLILDIYMAGMDGFETISLLKRINPSLPIIVITGNTSLDVERKTRDKGIFYYFTKPFDMEEMKKVVKLAIKTYYARKR